MSKANYKEQIDFIMDNFDFKNIEDSMKTLNWEWRRVGVPSKKQLKAEAERLLNKVLDRGMRYVSCGGFIATRYNKTLHLFFSLNDISGREYSENI